MDISIQQHVLGPVVFLVMITIGLELKLEQFQTLLRNPRIPLLGTLIHTASFPLIAVTLILLSSWSGYAMSETIVLGMLLIAACPSGGFSNVLTLMAGANLPLSVTLTAVSSLFSFLSVPLLLALFAPLVAGLDKPIELPVGATLLQLFVLVLVPIALGMGLRKWREGFFVRHLQRLQGIGQVVLYVTVGLLVIESLDVMIAGATEALPWSLLLCALNLFVCYQLAKAVGLGMEDRVTVAMEGSIRNLAVAFLIAANVLERMDIAALPTVYFIAVLIVAIIFAKTWRYLVGESARS